MAGSRVKALIHDLGISWRGMSTFRMPAVDQGWAGDTAGWRCYTLRRGALRTMVWA